MHKRASELQATIKMCRTTQLKIDTSLSAKLSKTKVIVYPPISDNLATLKLFLNDYSRQYPNQSVASIYHEDGSRYLIKRSKTGSYEYYDISFIDVNAYCQNMSQQSYQDILAAVRKIVFFNGGHEISKNCDLSGVTYLPGLNTSDKRALHELPFTILYPGDTTPPLQLEHTVVCTLADRQKGYSSFYDLHGAILRSSSSPPVPFNYAGTKDLSITHSGDHNISKIDSFLFQRHWVKFNSDTQSFDVAFFVSNYARKGLILFENSTPAMVVLQKAHVNSSGDIVDPQYYLVVPELSKSALTIKQGEDVGKDASFACFLTASSSNGHIRFTAKEQDSIALSTTLRVNASGRELASLMPAVLTNTETSQGTASTAAKQSISVTELISQQTTPQDVASLDHVAIVECDTNPMPKRSASTVIPLDHQVKGSVIGSISSSDKLPLDCISPSHRQGPVGLTSAPPSDSRRINHFLKNKLLIVHMNETQARNTSLNQLVETAPTPRLLNGVYVIRLQNIDTDDPRLKDPKSRMEYFRSIDIATVSGYRGPMSTVVFEVPTGPSQLSRPDAPTHHYYFADGLSSLIGSKTSVQLGKQVTKEVEALLAGDVPYVFDHPYYQSSTPKVVVGSNVFNALGKQDNSFYSYLERLSMEDLFGQTREDIREAILQIQYACAHNKVADFRMDIERLLSSKFTNFKRSRDKQESELGQSERAAFKQETTRLTAAYQGAKTAYDNAIHSVIDGRVNNTLVDGKAQIRVESRIVQTTDDSHMPPYEIVAKPGSSQDGSPDRLNAYDHVFKTLQTFRMDLKAAKAKKDSAPIELESMLSDIENNLKHDGISGFAPVIIPNSYLDSNSPADASKQEIVPGGQPISVKEWLEMADPDNPFKCHAIHNDTCILYMPINQTATGETYAQLKSNEGMNALKEGYHSALRLGAISQFIVESSSVKQISTAIKKDRAMLLASLLLHQVQKSLSDKDQQAMYIEALKIVLMERTSGALQIDQFYNSISKIRGKDYSVRAIYLLSTLINTLPYIKESAKQTLRNKLRELVILFISRTFSTNKMDMVALDTAAKNSFPTQSTYLREVQDFAATTRALLLNANALNTLKGNDAMLVALYNKISTCIKNGEDVLKLKPLHSRSNWSSHQKSLVENGIKALKKLLDNLCCHMSPIQSFFGQKQTISLWIADGYFQVPTKVVAELNKLGVSNHRFSDKFYKNVEPKGFDQASASKALIDTADPHTTQTFERFLHQLHSTLKQVQKKGDAPELKASIIDAAQKLFVLSVYAHDNAALRISFLKKPSSSQQKTITPTTVDSFLKIVNTTYNTITKDQITQFEYGDSPEMFWVHDFGSNNDANTIASHMTKIRFRDMNESYSYHLGMNMVERVKIMKRWVSLSEALPKDQIRLAKVTTKDITSTQVRLITREERNKVMDSFTSKFHFDVQRIGISKTPSQSSNELREASDEELKIAAYVKEGLAMVEGNDASFTEAITRKFSAAPENVKAILGFANMTEDRLKKAIEAYLLSWRANIKDQSKIRLALEGAVSTFNREETIKDVARASAKHTFAVNSLELILNYAKSHTINEDTLKRWLDIVNRCVCPITCAVFNDPVTFTLDGMTYERSALEQWLANNNTSPLTGQDFSSDLNPQHRSDISREEKIKQAIYPCRILDEVLESIDDSTRDALEEALSKQESTTSNLSETELIRAWETLSQLNNNNALSLENYLICPITQELLEDPVIDPYGQVYSRKAIEQWLQYNTTSPCNRQPLTANQLAPFQIAKNLLAALPKEG